MKYFSYLLIIILSYFVYEQHNKIITLNTKVNSLDNKTDNIKKKDSQTTQPDYKETFYLTQLNNATTLVLSVIGFALVIAGLFSFSIIDTKFKVISNTNQNVLQGLKTEFSTLEGSINTSVDSLRNEMTDYSENYKKYESRHNDFEFRLNISQAYENIDKYNYYEDKGNKDNALYHALYSLSDFTNCYFNDSEKSDESLKSDIIITIIATLNNLIVVKEYKISVELKYLILENIKNVRRLNNETIDTLLSKLHSTIEFENRITS